MSAKQKLKEARIHLCKNQKEFADFVGVSKGGLSLWESGKRLPGYRNIRKIVTALKAENFDCQYIDFMSNE